MCFRRLTRRWKLRSQSPPSSSRRETGFWSSASLRGESKQRIRRSRTIGSSTLPFEMANWRTSGSMSTRKHWRGPPRWPRALGRDPSRRTAATTWPKSKYEVIMTTKPRIAIVIGSTRPGRYADKAAGWMLKQTQARDDIEAELLDLRDHPLPFFDEKGPLISTPSENAEALRWQETLAPYDGFVFVVAEYNHSITGVLKNALDQAYKEWGRKPFTAIGYGGGGGARAVEEATQIT